MDVKNPAIDNEDTLINKKMRFWKRAKGPTSSNISSKVVIPTNFADFLKSFWDLTQVIPFNKLVCESLRINY